MLLVRKTKSPDRMSLISRINTAITRERSSASPVQDKALFPYDTVRSFLTSNSIVNAMSVDAKEVHSAIIDYHKLVSGPKEDFKVSTLVQPTCKECGKGYVLLDSREGCTVCDYCGLVDSVGLNVMPDYEEQDHSNKHNPHWGKVPGVAQWMCEKMASSNRDTSWQILEDLQHWNQFTRMNVDELTEIANVMKGWTQGRYHTYNVRIAAALLYKDLKDKFPNEEEVRSIVRLASYRHVNNTSSLLEEVTKTEKVLSFFCEHCNKGFDCRKSARWHCRKRRRTE